MPVRMKNHWDWIFGSVGTLGTITLGHVNAALACATGLLTVCVMLLKLRREWKNRNTPKPDEN
jgi:hypothetical protein